MPELKSKLRGMVTCPQCGHKDYLAKYCVKCGAKMTSTFQFMRCGGCGMEVDDTDKFCAECGKPLEETP